ncbi:MAG: TetR/AcrR family transcriptional regulator [Hyphomicrobiaceae bacterium]
MTRKATGRTRKAAVRSSGDPSAAKLAAKDWVDGASELLIDENIRGVRIAALCHRLGVTKGSFYWHFGSRQDLLDAILDAWRKKNTLNVMSRIVSMAAPLRSLRGLLALPRRAASARGARVEMSVRDWARRDDATFRSLREIDHTRLRSFEQLFLRLGFAGRDAKARAYVAYAVMMGDSVLKDTIGGEAPAETYLDTAIGLLTAPPAAARTGGGKRTAQPAH